jgi:hypothetical protein
MTNDALVRIFFMGVATGKEESYGFSIKPSFAGVTLSPTGHPAKIKRGDLALFSKTSQFPLARKLSGNQFIISAPNAKLNSGNWKKHLSLVAMIAKQIGVGLLASPLTDETKFQKYMERKINDRLSFLARSNSVAPILQPALILTDLYQNLIRTIRTLLEGEILLKLPRYPVALLDTDEAQVLWAWLIKENPEKKDRELFMRMYTLSRLFSAQQRDVEIDLGTVDISSM